MKDSEYLELKDLLDHYGVRPLFKVFEDCLQPLKKAVLECNLSGGGDEVSRLIARKHELEGAIKYHQRVIQTLDNLKK